MVQLRSMLKVADNTGAKRYSVLGFGGYQNAMVNLVILLL